MTISMMLLILCDDVDDDHLDGDNSDDEDHDDEDVDACDDGGEDLSD